MLKTASLLLGLGVLHPGADDWYMVHTRGYNYLMPPIACTVGELPPHNFRYRYQADMDRQYLPGTSYRHVYGHATPHPDGSWTVDIAYAMPAEVTANLKTHELAHLRGCKHPD